jgi:hypothetical protein
MLYFLLPYFLDNLRRLFIPAKRAFNQPIIFQLMFSPLSKAFQVKSIQANCVTSGCCVAFDYLHVANGAKVIFIIFFLFFNDDFVSGHVDLDIF